MSDHLIRGVLDGDLLSTVSESCWKWRDSFCFHGDNRDVDVAAPFAHTDSTHRFPRGDVFHCISYNTCSGGKKNVLRGVHTACISQTARADAERGWGILVHTISLCCTGRKAKCFLFCDSRGCWAGGERCAGGEITQVSKAISHLCSRPLFHHRIYLFFRDP